MSITVKGGAVPPSAQAPRESGRAVADAYARVAGKKAKKAGGPDPAAEAVAGAIDDCLSDDEEREEREAAEQWIEEIEADMPPGSGEQQAEAIAQLLKKKLESSRDQRGHAAQKIQKKLDSL